VAQDLGAPKPRVDISTIFDLGASREPTDIARDKDKMLGEAVCEEYVRKTGQRAIRRTRARPRRR
jgi:hypothetical protein